MSISQEVVIEHDHSATAYRIAMSLRNLPALVVPAFRSHVRRLQKPLTGSTTWFETTGEVRTRKVLSGLGDLEQIELDQPMGHLEALNLRLWNLETRLWSVHFANARGGTMAGPASVVGFKDGRGDFVDVEPIDGRQTFVRESFFPPSKFDAAYSG
jgi:hypothetical protein